MAKIESYQQATQPLSFSDMLIGTDVLGPIPNATKNFSLTELYNLFATIPNVGNLQDTLNVGNSATQDIFLSGIISCNSITPTFIEDYTLTTGIAGQFLQSSALGIIWATPSVPNLQSVLNSGNTATQDIFLTGNISLTKVIPLQIQDSTSSTGSVGQSLFVSVGGLLWANPATVTSIATSGLISGGPITTTGTISTSMTTNRLVGRGTSGTGVMEEIILGANLSLTGTTLNATGGGVTSVTGTFPISSSGGATPAISMLQSSSITDGYLSSIDWTTFNSKQTSITLTTLGTSGASTFIGATLNIPQYTDTYVGTVTSVALTVPSAFSVTGSPITSSGTLAITGVGLGSQYIDGTGALQAFPSVGSGTVTSVAATVPTFLSVSGSPITTSGTLAVTLSGTALPVLNGGTGVTTSTGSGDTVLSTSPTLVTPILGSASATALTFTSTAVSGLTINKLTTAQRQALTPVMGDVVYDTTIGTTCTYNGTFWQYTKEYYVTSYVTTTTTLASTITGLTTFVLEANSSYSIDGKFFIQCNNNGGIKFGNSLPVGASSRINYWGIGASSTQSQQVGSQDGALTTIGINRVNLSSSLAFGGLITTVATAGSIDINFASSIGGQTSTIYGLFSVGRQSKITLTKIA
jgi:hypothetical protein